MSHYSQLLLLPVGIPPMPVPKCSTQNLAHFTGVESVLNTTKMKNVTQGWQIQIIIKCYPLVVHTMLKQFAI